MRDEPLIMIQSCAADRVNGRQHAGLDTWGTEWGHLVERRIVLGAGSNEHPRGSEVLLDCPDTYETIPYKIHAAAKWALDWGFGWVFYGDTDTYVHVPRLLRTEFRRAQYIGYNCSWGDMWIGRTLAKAGIKLEHDARYWPVEPPYVPPNFITAHLGRTTGGFKPEWMHEFHKKVLVC